MNNVNHDKIRQAVRQQYGLIAENKVSGCGGVSCCGSTNSNADTQSQTLGYSATDTDTAPKGSNLGLGCGNPQAIANIKAGDTVLDLGSGGGFDCFLAAKQVGHSGHVIGVDMTPAMISKARANADKSGNENVEFRLGEIENLPVASGTVDVIISNCVVNLSPDKPRVFAESYRTLKPGGRLAISDIVALAELPDEIRQDTALYTGCVAGASLVVELEEILRQTGFQQIRIAAKDEGMSLIHDRISSSDTLDNSVSATIEAIKPVSENCIHGEELNGT